MTFLLRGFLVGFAIAAPVGPIGVLCIRRTLDAGRLTGFVTGLGAATADSAYGAVAAFGLTYIQQVLTGQAFLLRLLGGSFLLYLGIRTLRAAPAASAAQTKPLRGGLAGAYLSTVVLTLTNPATILSFTVVFAGLGSAGRAGEYTTAALLAGGVFVGSAAWWLTLSTTVGFFRERFTTQGMRWINRAAGAILMLFGLAALATL